MRGSWRWRSGHEADAALTNHERHILALFAEGNDSASIARNLGISPHTLRNHPHHINRRLSRHSRLEAVTHAHQRGQID